MEDVRGGAAQNAVWVVVSDGARGITATDASRPLC
jgi:hypothetical protein